MWLMKHKRAVTKRRMTACLGSALLVVCTLGLSAGGPTTASAASDSTCMKSWTEASSVARSKKLASASEVLEQAKSRVKGKVLSISLCNRGGKFTYKLVFHDSKGRVKNMEVDARKPF